MAPSHHNSELSMPKALVSQRAWAKALELARRTSNCHVMFAQHKGVHNLTLLQSFLHYKTSYVRTSQPRNHELNTPQHTAYQNGTCSSGDIQHHPATREDSAACQRSHATHLLSACQQNVQSYYQQVSGTSASSLGCNPFHYSPETLITSPLIAKYRKGLVN